MPTSGGGGGGSGGGLPQPGPLGYNIARRKPRQRWVGSFMGMFPGIPTTGISALIARVVTARPRGGRVVIRAAMPPGPTSAVTLPPKAIIRPVGIAASPRHGSVRTPALPLAPLATTPIPSPGPLSWNPARRKPRVIWRVGLAGAAAAGLSASGRMIAGRPTTAADLSRRCGRVWMPGATGSQPPLLRAVRPVAARSRWRAGRSALLGLPAAVTPIPSLTFIVTARPSHRACPGFTSAFRFPADIAQPPLRLFHATLMPTAAGRISAPLGGPGLALAVPQPGAPTIRIPRRLRGAPSRRRSDEAATGMGASLPARGARVRQSAPLQHLHKFGYRRPGRLFHSHCGPHVHDLDVIRPRGPRDLELRHPGGGWQRRGTEPRLRRHDRPGWLRQRHHQPAGTT